MAGVRSFLNIGAEKFRSILTGKYVDKTGLLNYFNRCLDTESRYFLISRPRRFGKSYAAAMVNAYYQWNVNSEGMFKDKNIAKMPPLPDGPHKGEGWLDFIGRYDCICINLATFVTRAVGKQNTMDRLLAEKGAERVRLRWINYLADLIMQDIGELYGQEIVGDDLIITLANMVRHTGRKVIWICDEWDLFFREKQEDVNVGEDYIKLLRGLFKDDTGIMDEVFAGAYMTGIMPMCKIKGESAVSNFENFSMLSPDGLSSYIGFTRQEVKDLCAEFDGDFSKMEEWYDGYCFRETGEIYNPQSVMKALKRKIYTSYWVESASYEILKDRVTQHIGGLREAILGLLAGEEISVDTGRFTNIIKPSTNINDELTLLVHLGYLSYNEESSSVAIPNLEIRNEFLRSLIENKHAKTLFLLSESDKLLKASWEGDEEAVADSISAIHQIVTDPKHYHNERDLTAVIRAAYFTANDYYISIAELPGGKGYADLVYIPKRGTEVPLMIVELKWDTSKKAAIAQIKERNYPAMLKDYGGEAGCEILLIGITYSRRTKRHVCKIEKFVNKDNMAQLKKDE